MRPLLFLFAFLPLSSALKCFAQQRSERGGIAYPDLPDKTTLECNNVAYCMIKAGSNEKHGNFSVQGCGQPETCSADGCKFIIENGTAVHVCCCTRWFCNTEQRFDSTKKYFENWSGGVKLQQKLSQSASAAEPPVECFAELKIAIANRTRVQYPTDKISKKCNGLCMIESGNSARNGAYTLRGCARPSQCNFEGCQTIVENGAVIDVCCCKGDYCNTHSVLNDFKEQYKTTTVPTLLRVPEVNEQPIYYSDPKKPGWRDIPVPTIRPYPTIKKPSRYEDYSRSTNPNPPSLQDSKTTGWKNSAGPTVLRPLPSFPKVQLPAPIAPGRTVLRPLPSFPKVQLLAPTTTSTHAPPIKDMPCFSQQSIERGSLIRPDIPPENFEMMCNRGDFCMKMSGNSERNGVFTIKGCAEPGLCSIEGCRIAHDRDAGLVELCCCKGKRCNSNDIESYGILQTTTEAVSSKNPFPSGPKKYRNTAAAHTTLYSIVATVMTATYISLV